MTVRLDPAGAVDGARWFEALAWQGGEPEMSAVSGVRRDFIEEQKVLRREERDDVPGWMWNAGYGLLAVVGGLEVAGIGWLMARAARGSRSRTAPVALRRGTVKEKV